MFSVTVAFVFCVRTARRACPQPLLVLGYLGKGLSALRLPILSVTTAALLGHRG